jgi:hypothetical protein
MCDTVDGEIILAAPVNAPYAQEFLAYFAEAGDAHYYLGLEPGGDLRDKIRNSESEPSVIASELLRANLFRCLPGRESSVISAIYRLFQVWSFDHVENLHDVKQDEITLWVAPNHVLTAAGVIEPPGASVVSVSSLDLGQPTRTEDRRRARIALLDSGVSSALPAEVPPVRARRNFLGARDPFTPEDTSGHGTAVARCIASASDHVDLNVLQVIGADDRATEWDVLAALGSQDALSADVVNLSMAFGLQDADCGQCGSRHKSSLSEVFQFVIQVLIHTGTVIVAAAGNHKVDPNADAPELLYPARLPGVVAVGALDDYGSVLGTSNLGLNTPRPDECPVLVFAPGRAPAGAWPGEEGRKPASSYACGYVSAMVSVIKAVAECSGSDAVALLEAAALPLGGNGRYGSGRVQWPDLVRPQPPDSI